MGKSLRSKKGKRLRTSKRNKLVKWNNARTAELHDKLVEISANPTNLEEKMQGKNSENLRYIAVIAFRYLDLLPQPVDIKLTDETTENAEKDTKMQTEGAEESTTKPKKKGRPKVIVTMELDSSIKKDQNTKRVITRSKLGGRQGRSKTRD